MFGSIRLTVSAPQPYFTVSTVGEAGFMDQLAQFTIFFKLGRSLNYQYFHTPLDATRSSSCTFDFVGLNDFFSEAAVAPFESFRFIDIAISDKVVQEHGISSFESMLKYARAQVESRRAEMIGDVVVRFRLCPGGRGFYGIIHRGCPDLPDQIDLLGIYREARKHEPRTALYQTGKTRVLVHMRQGDTGLVETPWKTFISAWKFRTGEYLQEFASYDMVSNEHIEVENYRQFIAALKTCFSDELSFVFCSDGYRTTLDHLLQKTDQLGFDESRLRLLRESRQTYDQRKFGWLDQFPDSVSQIGESDENFMDLINSAVEADVIVTGTQQTMMVQFAARYYDLKKPKVIIILHRGAEIPDRGWHNLSEKKAVIITVDVHNYQIEEVATRVRNELAKVYQ